MQGHTREPAVAGSFYPRDHDALAGDVDRLLAQAMSARARPELGQVRGVIAPHAGYAYSGPIAASAYALLTPTCEHPTRVVVLGPSHFVALHGLAVPSHRAWRTPLGGVAIDGDARDRLVSAGAAVDDEVHRSEHSIEVQLPFLQRCLPDVPVLPVAVGSGDPARAAAMLEPLLDGPALLVVSTDLSHYRDAATARRLDARTAAAVEALDHAALGPADACGVDPLRVAVSLARRRGLRIALLDLRNSADTAGDPSRVVGYAAFAIVAGRRR